MKKKAKGALHPAARKLVSFPRMAAVSALMAASMLAANLAFADPAKATVNIPPQELSSALKTLAGQTNSQLLFATDALQGVRTEGVSGSYTPEEALKRLLKGTRFTYRTTDANTFTVQGEAEKKPEAAAAARLSEVVVTATKTERGITDVPASVTIIGKEEIANMRVQKTEDLLRNVVGVDFKSPAGPFTASVNLRGLPDTFAGGTTLILVDGLAVEPVMLINRRFAWSMVSPDDIERIEIVRGPVSALYGSSAAGGVINIITKKGDGKPSASVTAGYGSHNARSIDASAGGSLGALDVRLSASRFETDGYKAYPTADSAWWGQVDLAGRDYTDEKVGVDARYRLSDDQELSLGLRHFSKEGAWLGGHPNYRNDTQGVVTTLGYRQQIGERLNLKASLAHSDFDTRNTFDGYAWGMVDLALVDKSHEDEKAWQGELQADLRLGDANTLTAGIAYGTGEWRISYADPAGIPYSVQSIKSRTQGYYLQDEHRFGDKVILTVGGRYDTFKYYDDVRNGVTKAESSDNAFNPRVGLRYNPTQDTSFYVSAGTAFLPAPNSLKYRSGGIWLNNPDLKPEDSVTYEAGADWNIAGVKAKAALFHTRYENKISSIWTGGKLQFQNLGEVTVNGAELGVETTLAKHWRPFANYTYTASEITKNPSNPAWEGNTPAFTPKNKFNAGFVYDNPSWFTARVAGRYVDERYRDDANTEAKKAGSFFVADAKISKRLSLGGALKHLDISLAVNNLFDRKYSEFWYEKADGRNYWLGLAAKF